MLVLMNATAGRFFSPLLTDLYQLTMAQGYWAAGQAQQEAVFHLFFRKAPFAGGHAIASGLEDVVAYLRGFRFSSDDLAYLATLRDGYDEAPLFDPRFLGHLEALRLRLDVDAITEGTLVFPHEPLVRIKGSILEAQLLETTLLNLVNFQTLVATKAARICAAARGAPVIEFGLRRAQGPDGALAASRAAYVGGCAATSNVLAGQTFGIPVRGTHAHSWVMSFDSEPEAFAAYAAAMPNNCVFLVDTYDTLEGVRHAIDAAKKLRAAGHRFGGVRLDSGDLAWLSVEARKLLDAAGFTEAAIVASNDLDEHVIESLHAQGAAIGVFGVGTKLVTAYDQPALGGVYKLGAVRTPGGAWQPRVKLSEQTAKVSTPGVQGVRRFRDAKTGEPMADMIYDEDHPPPAAPVIVDPADPLRTRPVDPAWKAEELLVPVMRAGRIVYTPPPLAEVRARAAAELAALSPARRRLQNPHAYPVGLEGGLSATRERLVRAARERRAA